MNVNSMTCNLCGHVASAETMLEHLSSAHPEEYAELVRESAEG